MAFDLAIWGGDLMATLVLSTIGRDVAGPLGGIFGALAGSAIDRAVLGGSNRAALTRQSTDYGALIPRVYGKIRVAGGVLWSTGLNSAGLGGKLAGGSQSYTTSVAIGISARAITSVGRIWAEGKLIRDHGQFAIAGSMRIYLGTESQTADPLIVAVEGAANAPAYRGIAYVVFETIALAQFADRVPTFSFEVVADPGAVQVSVIAADLFAAAGVTAPDASALTTTIDGYCYVGDAALASALDQLAGIAPHDAVEGGSGLRLAPPSGASPIMLSDAEVGAHAGAKQGVVRSWRRESVMHPPQTVNVGYLDALRYYQAGQQTASGAGASRIVQSHDLPAVMQASVARGIAERLLRDAETARAARTVALPYARAAIEVGDAVTVSGDPTPWRVRRQAIEGMVVSLDLEALPNWAAVPLATDAGRVAANMLQVQGVTLLRALDLPDFTSSGASGPRLWLGLSGADAAWRGAEIFISYDAGASFASLGVTRTQVVIGGATGVLADGPTGGWDEAATVEVALANANGWLQSSTAASVLAGANLAVIGAELIQFRTAIPTTPGRFVLSGLRRGRFGTEFATASHAVGDVFALLDPTRLLALDMPAARIGTTIRLKAVGPNEIASAVADQPVRIGGVNLRTLSPVNLAIARGGDGTLSISWVRRSRLAFGWPVGAPTPLGEVSELYTVTLTPTGGAPAAYQATTPSLAISPAQQIAQAGVAIAHGSVAVAQVSALVGAGPAAVGGF